jgi:outer membrane protein OmpA-like peptidoglycan-associated protein
MLISLIALASAARVNTYDVDTEYTKGQFAGLESLVVDPAAAVKTIQPAQAPFPATAERTRNEAAPGDNALVFTNPTSTFAEYSVNGTVIGTIGPFATARLEGLQHGMYDLGLKLPTGYRRDFVVRLGPVPHPKVPVTVTLGEKKIELSDKVYFEFDSAVIAAESHELLDAVASLLVAHPEVLKVSIEGHTDSRGSDEYNQKLSEARAAAVRDYLVSKGVTADRLASAGFGESRPVDPADTEEAWEANRRVEFNVVARAEPQPALATPEPLVKGKGKGDKTKGAGKDK